MSTVDTDTPSGASIGVSLSAACDRAIAVVSPDTIGCFVFDFVSLIIKMSVSHSATRPLTRSSPSRPGQKPGTATAE